MDRVFRARALLVAAALVVSVAGPAPTLAADPIVTLDLSPTEPHYLSTITFTATIAPAPA